MRFEPLRWPGPAALDSVAYQTTLPWRALRAAHRHQAAAIVAQSPYEGLSALLVSRIAPHRPRVIIEVHGDWRTAGRDYGSPARRLAAPVTDRLAALALRGADATRAVSADTARLVQEVTGRPPTASYPAFMDAEVFLANPPSPFPPAPRLVWIGALQPVKGVDLLAAVWTLVGAAVPEAELTVVGDGPLRAAVQGLASAGGPGGVVWRPRLDAHEVAGVLDAGTALLLTSRSEGLGRVILEAFARGRPVIAPAVGGVRELVTDGENGRLAESRDPRVLAELAVELLTAPAAAAALGRRARSDAERLLPSPDAYAEATLALVEAALARSERATRSS